MFIVLRKKTILTAIAVILLVAVSLSVVIGLGAREAKTERKLPVYAVESGQNAVALTFDASWGAERTSLIMDVLEKYEVKGTFFLTGIWIDAYPDKVKEIAARGHEIQNHSLNHLNMSKLSVTEQIKEIETVNQKIEALTGKKPLYFRPPFGDYDNTLIATVRSLGMQSVQWDIDSLDWKKLSGGQIADRVSKARDGSVILCHNNSEHIVEALPLILEGLKNKKLKPVTVSELIAVDNYNIDSSGLQLRSK
ncbi:MAG: polysaccharide deacetylase family protein [Christensenellaceae bacterium]|jgi:polysaccharide deacetylase family sporulation protein PdaB|nr:polysaccharide deacetylase family protein [Christensenellaceae bacterium]